jgi:hypothetical protein
VLIIACRVPRDLQFLVADDFAAVANMVHPSGEATEVAADAIGA